MNSESKKALPDQQTKEWKPITQLLSIKQSTVCLESVTQYLNLARRSLWRTQHLIQIECLNISGDDQVDLMRVHDQCGAEVTLIEQAMDGLQGIDCDVLTGLMEKYTHATR